MEIVIWILVQLALFGGLLWFVSARRDKELGVARRRPAPKNETRELHALRAQRARALNMPLAELARPAKMEDIVGQEDAIRALRAAMCGPNPQHVLLYGPPGVGKTCAARLVLEEAKRNPESPFDEQSAFVEVDATCVRFDERAIADPLIGSVHDPIYQGAGTLGAQGVPQPKPGAVTRAHCGVLFLDEIGELHPMQMNKLLKVLEDRRVYFDSAYYSPENAAIPPHIHDIFQNGLPADFRLIGATTRSPEEIPPALRSRCVELFFRPLGQADLAAIAQGAAHRLGVRIGEAALQTCASYCASGRDAVNIVQLAGGAAHAESGGKRVGTCAQVRHGAQKLYRVPLFLQGIFWPARAQNGDGAGVYLKGLFCAGRVHQRPLHLQRSAHAGFGNLFIVCQLGGFEHHLYRLEARAVRKGEKPDVFRISHGFGPAAHGHRRAVRRRLAEQGRDLCSFHIFSS